MPESEAEVWIGWGTHVFHDGDDSAGKGSALDRYIRAKIGHAQADPGDDFFGAMTRMTFDGRPLTTDEMVGIANLVFAGGRDTVITAVAAIISALAGKRAVLDWLCAEPKRIAVAVEEFVRFTSPLTHIGRVCPREALVGAHPVASDARVSLCWASANFDETVFDAPEELRLDRMPNPHLGFGSGHHSCLGAAQARTILRSLIAALGERTGAIIVRDEAYLHESYGSLQRQAGHERLVARMMPKRDDPPRLSR
jgi:cytochrome P450